MIVKVGHGSRKSKSRINAVEMRSLRSTCGVSRRNRCRNNDVRGRRDLKEVVVTRVERGVNEHASHQKVRDHRRLWSLATPDESLVHLVKSFSEERDI
ncbi:hypothetical protein EVAR_79174_1 [Eumeta japonica]|uniref:Uncharacterized protein n=1 Tax=Eumeta variegata TaxID=151549 RepID=A0A4C1UT55_EUMVA|nr:hypothetical protein EVAR_79174_1 [Eumeta japonica]